MVQNEKWVTWEPAEEARGKFSLQSIKQHKNSLSLSFSSENNVANSTLQLTFSNSIYFYSRTEETACLEMLSNFIAEYGYKMYYNTFFQIHHSSLVEEIKGIDKSSLNTPLFHFSFIEINSIIDVIASALPVCSWTITPSKSPSDRRLHSLPPESDGKVGKLDDGRMIMANPYSTAGWPSLIIQEDYEKKGFLYTKVRYTN